MLLRIVVLIIIILYLISNQYTMTRENFNDYIFIICLYYGIQILFCLYEIALHHYCIVIVKIILAQSNIIQTYFIIIYEIFEVEKDEL